MALEDDVQLLLDWRQSVIDNARENHEFSEIGTISGNELIRLENQGQSYKVTFSQLQQNAANIEPLPDNPTGADDGIYYELESGNITIYIVDSGNVFKLDNRVIPGTYVDSEHFIPDAGGDPTLKEGYIYVDGGNWYRYNGSELVSFASANISNSNLTLDASRTLSTDGKTLTIDGTTYGLIVDNGVVRLKNGSESLTLDVSGLTDSHTQEFQNKDGTIALLEDFANYPERDQNEEITGDWKFTGDIEVPEATQDNNPVRKKELDEVEQKINKVYKPKGNVINLTALFAITDPEIGDTYNVKDDGDAENIDYAYVGSGNGDSGANDEWNNLGGKIDLSDYALLTDLGNGWNVTQD